MIYLILLAGVLVKVPALSQPLLGYFASYQMFNAMMAEMMIRDPRQALLVPTTLMILNGPPALQLLYYPFASLCAAAGTMCFPGSIEFWGRTQAMLLTLASGWAVFDLAKRYFGERIGLLAAMIFTFSPMGLISGISFQNEAAAIFILLLSFLSGGTSRAWRDFLSGGLFSVTLILRLHFIGVLPALVWAIFAQNFTWRRLLFFLLGVVIPVTAWFSFVYHVEIKSNSVLTSLFSQMGEGRFLVQNLLRSPKFYVRIFDLLMAQWVTPLLFPFLVLSCLSYHRLRLPFLLWLLGALATIVLLPQKVYDHPFYLISGLPAASILTACLFYDFMNRFPKKVLVLFLGFFVAVSLRYYLPPILTIPTGASKIQQIGKHVEMMTQPEDRIVASYGQSVELLYYCRRMGWSFDLQMATRKMPDQKRYRDRIQKGYGDPIQWLERLRSEGARYLVIGEPEQFYQNHEFSDYVDKTYPEIAAGSDLFRMYDLTQSR
ncbi:MAG: glycosyltransferase family 39 protein [Candidatus Omnitrophica bacterium]|nr:glycosyltransferase family 39 protein [Candidatus Omnitrophota bacterium]